MQVSGVSLDLDQRGSVFLAGTVPRVSTIEEQMNAASCNSRDVSFKAGEPNHPEGSYLHPRLHQFCHAVCFCEEFSPD